MIREIVEVGADIGARKIQEEWIEYFNSRNEVMLSMPDLYHTGKDKKLLKALQKDFKDDWEVTSTRLIYQPDSLDGKVVHYFGSSVIKPVEIELEIPDYSEGKLVKDVLDDPNGLAFLQAIFGTEDDKKTILENLVKLSEKEKDEIKVWTPNQKSRKEYHEKPLLCGNYDIGFLIYCYIDFDGCSSAVRRSDMS